MKNNLKEDLQKICDHLGVDIQDVISRKKYKYLIIARKIYCYLMWEKYEGFLSQQTITDVIKRKHTTLIRHRDDVLQSIHVYDKYGLDKKLNEQLKEIRCIIN